MMAKNYLLVPLRAIALVIWVLLMPLVFVVAQTLKLPRYNELPHVIHAGMCRIFGVRVHTSGDETRLAPALYVSNHISYLDIIVLGRLRAFFIAKSEVASWPVFGQLARFQNTLFIERKAGRARQQTQFMQEHLRKGQRLTLFAEGTSTNGTHVEAFKSSLFEAANLGEAEPRVAIQPITVAYTHHNDKPMNQAQLDHYAWYATMPFGSHFAALFPLKKVDVKIHFHPVCYLDEFASRKDCAEHCQKLVAQKLADLLQTAATAR